MSGWHEFASSLTCWPELVTILLRALGAQYQPRAATEAYAAAMFIGETSTDPRVKLGMLSAGYWYRPSITSPLSSDLPSALVMPMSTAVLTTLQSPTCFSSWAK